VTERDPFDQVFGINEDLATNGVWVDFGSKIKVLIGFQGEANKNFVKAVELETKPFQRDIEKGTLTTEDGKTLLSRILARGVIYDWKGEGLPPYSFEEGMKQLTKKNSLFFQEVQEMSKRLATFKEKENEDALGN
jgi:hypothetical protein